MSAPWAALALSLVVAVATGESANAAAEATAMPAESSKATAASATAVVEPSEAEWTAIKRTIGDQLTALREGDASRAFSHASSGIRARFGDAPTFLRMVQEGYAALLVARYTEFLEGAAIDGRTIQPLRLVMHDDSVLVALYEMQRDESGAWRIAGCVIAESTVKST